MRRTAIATVVVSLLFAGFAETAVRRRAVRSPGPPIATPPDASPDAYTTSRDVALDVPAPGVLANDLVNAAVIASFGVTGGQQTTLGFPTTTSGGGTITLQADGRFTYAPAAGFIGVDEFRYVLTNSGGSSTTSVTLTILPPPPAASADTYTTPQNTPLEIAQPGLLANDVLSTASVVSYGATTGLEQKSVGTSTATAQGGTVIANADGSFRYDAAANFTGTDSFKYVIGNGGGTSTATVTITVQSGALPADLDVAAPGFFFTFTGVDGENPVLVLKRGQTYRFHVTTPSIHPFEILNAPAGTVTNNDISDGTVTFRVPLAAASYRYRCSLHAFGNVINTVP
jgi:hypothetical protein